MSNSKEKASNSKDEPKNDFVIEMLNITKEFSGIIANDNVTLQLKRGEIHALLGENGAGKSTLMSILFGLYHPEKGVIKKDGVEVDIKNPNIANELRIGMVHQHFKLVDIFTALDNIILGVEPTSKMIIKKNDAKKKVTELSEKYGLNVDLDAKVEDITVGMQQRIEILKMLYKDNDILIFDEPTAVLTPQEISELMKIMKEFANEGKSIIFITHKLNEIKEVANRCSVLRKGKYIGTVDVKTTSKEELSEMMIGKKLVTSLKKEKYESEEVVLEVNNISVASKINEKDAVKDVSFSLKQGEIVAIAGIEGNGQSELVYALTGLEPLKSGNIFLCGNDATKYTVRQRSAFMSHIPEDRHKHALVLDFALESNMALQRYWQPEFQDRGFIKFDEIRKHATKLIDQYDVRSGNGPTSITRELSGGNQQKAVIAREISKNSDIIIAVQPTRGLDVGAIDYIHEQLINQRNLGKGILLVSLEIDEVLRLADRIIVMYEGQIVGELDAKNITKNEIGLYMTGAKKDLSLKEAN